MNRRSDKMGNYTRLVRRLRKKNKQMERTQEQRELFNDQFSAIAVNSINAMLFLMNLFTTTYALASRQKAPTLLSPQQKVQAS